MAKYRRISIALALSLGILQCHAAFAQDQARPPADDPSWSVCSETAGKIEKELGLPAHILTAVSLAETGRSGPNRQVETWPWTVHDGTKGYYLGSLQEAVDFVRDIRSGGARSVDVGCMQVNLKHHPRAFTSVSQGFDAEANIRYAGSYLKALALDSGSWEEAIAKYHTQNPGLDLDYAPRVLAFWSRERGAGPVRVASAGIIRQVSAPPRVTVSTGAPTILSSSPAPGRFVIASASDPALQRAELTLVPSVTAPKVSAVPSVGASATQPRVYASDR